MWLWYRYEQLTWACFFEGTAWCMGWLNLQARPDGNHKPCDCWFVCNYKRSLFRLGGGKESWVLSFSRCFFFLMHHILLPHRFGAAEQRLGAASVFAVGFFTSPNARHNKCKVKHAVQHRQELFKHWEIREEYLHHALPSSAGTNGLLGLLLKAKVSLE